jgi:hypothetical protein
MEEAVCPSCLLQRLLQGDRRQLYQRSGARVDSVARSRSLPQQRDLLGTHRAIEKGRQRQACRSRAGRNMRS